MKMHSQVKRSMRKKVHRKKKTDSPLLMAFLAGIPDGFLGFTRLLDGLASAGCFRCHDG